MKIPMHRKQTNTCVGVTCAPSAIQPLLPLTEVAMIARIAGVMVLWAGVLAACSDTTNPAGTTGRVRVVNSVFQGNDVASAVPVAVDVLIDSSTGGAGLAGLAALALSGGNASGQGAGAHTGAGDG